MPQSDLVPCFYTGQDYRRDQPAELLPRLDVRRYKKLNLGKFVENGRVFLFFARLVQKAIAKLWDGPLGVGNLIPFSRSQNPFLAPQKLHYEVPRAGDRTIFARHHRKRIRVSGRNRFNVQLVPQPRIA